MAITSVRDIPRDSVAARAATLRMQGVGLNAITKQLSEEFEFNFTRTYMERLENTETYQRVVTEHRNAVVKAAINELKKCTSALVPKIVTALEKALDNGNVNAIPHALKILGIEGAEPDQKQQQNITVVLPGANKKQEKDVT